MEPISYYFKHPLELFEDLGSLIEDAERWIAYRTYDKYHVVKTDLEPHYWDTDSVMLSANFSLLVDFVEIELGSLAEDRDKLSFWRRLEYRTPLVLARIIYPAFRSPELGIKYIQDMIAIHENDIADPKNAMPWLISESEIEGQISYASYHLNFWKEVLSLYTWYKHLKANPSYEARDEVGLNAYADQLEQKYGNVHKFIKEEPNSKFSTMTFAGTDEEQKEYRRLLQLSWEKEKEHEKTIENNLIRLMKIRTGLWT